MTKLENAYWRDDSRPSRPADILSLDDGDLIVISNRQPYRHEESNGQIVVDQPAGGLTAGLDAVMRRIGGRWIAWGDGAADPAVVDETDSVTVPPGATDEAYTLTRVWLSDEEVEAYYYGFSNRVLWPLCHSTLSNMAGGGEYWQAYERTNERFAEAVATNLHGDSVVWFQDYHLALAPQRVREQTVADLCLVHNWHIPWPAWDVFRACPHSTELIRGLLGNDILGFHTPRYCTNFLSCVDCALPSASIDWERSRVTFQNHTTAVRAFPMGVPAEQINRQANTPQAETRWREFCEQYTIDAETVIAIGVDRLDYTKGVPQRLAALERFWERHPEWQGRLSYIQVGTESRSKINAYQQCQQAVADATDRINDRFGTDDWQPVVYTTEMLPNETLYALYRHADLGIVSPIRDGMNLVAQEFVAAQPDNDGALLLSEQAGAHDYLSDWVFSINPADTSSFAATIHDALTEPGGRRRARMQSLRHYVARNDISQWMTDIFETIESVRETMEVEQSRV